MRTPTIKRLLRQAGIDTTYIKINKHEIEVMPIHEYDDTDTVAHAVIAACKGTYSLGGFSTGYGSWCLSDGYQSKGDWNDQSSAHHY